jgi:hypothetical protein
MYNQHSPTHGWPWNINTSQLSLLSAPSSSLRRLVSRGHANAYSVLHCAVLLVLPCHLAPKHSAAAAWHLQSAGPSARIVHLFPVFMTIYGDLFQVAYSVHSRVCVAAVLYRGLLSPLFRCWKLLIR